MPETGWLRTNLDVFDNVLRSSFISVRKTCVRMSVQASEPPFHVNLRQRSRAACRVRVLPMWMWGLSTREYSNVSTRDEGILTRVSTHIHIVSARTRRTTLDVWPVLMRTYHQKMFYLKKTIWNNLISFWAARHRWQPGECYLFDVIYCSHVPS